MSTLAEDGGKNVIQMSSRGAGPFRNASKEKQAELIRLEEEARQEDLGRMRIIVWAFAALIIEGGGFLIWYSW